jgi:SAM-dependent methyltransferase
MTVPSGFRRRVRVVVEPVPLVGRSLVRSIRGAERRLRGTPASAAPFRVHPPPGPGPTDWAEPPTVEAPIEITRRRHDEEERPEPVFDLKLLEALNAEYAAKPLIADPPEYDHVAVLERARKRLLGVHRMIDLANRRVLEFGCGAGFEVWSLSHDFGADAYGVDIVERQGWPALINERTHLVLADLAVDRPFPPDHFDRVISFVTLEHVVHPYASLAELYRVLQPGGLAYLRANLYRGPLASHRYREIFFPYPHLLFSDDVIRQFYRSRGLPEQGAEWVNRLTWAEYEDHFTRIGFRIRFLKFTETAVDEGFYRRFNGILGRYPRTDLARDFFDVVLERPRARRWARRSRRAVTRVDE